MSREPSIAIPDHLWRENVKEGERDRVPLTLVNPRIQPYRKAYLPIHVPGTWISKSLGLFKQVGVGLPSWKTEKDPHDENQGPRENVSNDKKYTRSISCWQKSRKWTLLQNKGNAMRRKGPWLSVITCQMPQECHENNKKQWVAFQMTCQGSTTKSCCCFIASMILYLSDWGDLDN